MLNGNMSERSDEVEDPLLAEVADSEHQPLRTLSSEASSGDVEDFTSAHGLDDELELFRRASQLLHDDGDSERVNTTSIEQRAFLRESTHKWHQPRLLYFVIFVCSLGAIDQGWAQTGMNGANLYIPRALAIDSGKTRDSFILGLINCGQYLAIALFGSWLAEPVTHRLGRRGAICLATALCLVGNIGSSISPNWPVLVAFRVVIGTGLGLNA